MQELARNASKTVYWRLAEFRVFGTMYLFIYETLRVVYKLGGRHIPACNNSNRPEQDNVSVQQLQLPLHRHWSQGVALLYNKFRTWPRGLTSAAQHVRAEAVTDCLKSGRWWHNWGPHFCPGSLRCAPALSLYLYSHGCLSTQPLILSDVFQIHFCRGFCLQGMHQLRTIGSGTWRPYGQHVQHNRILDTDNTSPE